MNKEIEKAKEDLSFMNEGDYITREMSNSKDVLIKYIESLELINETWQVSNEMFREGIKELEQKESILDKVIDKLKETIKIEREFMKDTEHKSMAFHYSNGREVLSKEILEIIEGEKK